MESRCRTLSVRLSMQEYEQLQVICMERGARSVSEVARLALNALLNQNGETGHAPLTVRVTELDAKVQDLDREVERLQRLVEGKFQ